MTSESNERKRVSSIISGFDALLCAGELETVNMLLGIFPATLSPAEAVALLTVTAAASERLPERAALVVRVRAMLAETMPPGEVSETLRGLDGSPGATSTLALAERVAI